MTAKVELRRVQTTGGASYIVTLPKSWALDVGLKPKDFVAIIPQSDSLLIMPRGKVEHEALTETVIEVQPNTERNVVVREYISHYLAGYDIIKLHFIKRNSILQSYIKDIVRRVLIGVEIIEESSERITTQCLSRYADLPLKKALERMSVIASSMQKDSLKALVEGDQLLAKEVIMRDDEVDRFCHFIVRQLKIVLQNRFMIEEIGLKNPKDCQEYRGIAKSVERAADHAVYISKYFQTFDMDLSYEDFNEVIEMGSLSNTLFENAMRALFRFDLDLAHQTIGKVQTISKLEGEITEKLLTNEMDVKTILGLKLILESLRRIAEYGADIAEITLNLTV
ncbi:MAG: phosphate uptake regulator PhoU [Candidatus Methylarchaceae archaeon HK02M2]|nr:phosphate uptake regulator PhoU [Candidatus Methylarchaceae archaeon HK02M2]